MIQINALWGIFVFTQLVTVSSDTAMSDDMGAGVTDNDEVGGEQCKSALRKEIFKITGCACSIKISGSRWRDQVPPRHPPRHASPTIRRFSVCYNELMKDYVKIVVFVPEENADELRSAIGSAGGGVIGEYSFCSYSVKGVGRFKPSDKANPHIGSSGQLESVNEERIEVQCEKEQAQKIIDIIKKVHPYEEVVVDVYQLLSSS